MNWCFILQNSCHGWLDITAFNIIPAQRLTVRETFGKQQAKLWIIERFKVM